MLLAYLQYAFMISDCMLSLTQVLRRPHLLLVTLLLVNAAAMEVSAPVLDTGSSRVADSE